MKAGIIGGSGYTGAELLRLLAGHPDIEVTVVTAHAHAGQVVGEHTPSLAAAYPGLVYEAADPEVMDGLDLVFCALPHGESQRIAPELRTRVGLIVDLAADFRLGDPTLYPAWYGGSAPAARRSPPRSAGRPGRRPSRTRPAKRRQRARYRAAWSSPCPSRSSGPAGCRGRPASRPGTCGPPCR